MIVAGRAARPESLAATGSEDELEVMFVGVEGLSDMMSRKVDLKK